MILPAGKTGAKLVCNLNLVQVANPKPEGSGMKKLFVSFFLLISAVCFGQSAATKQFIKDSAEIMKVKLVRPQFKFDNRQTYSEKQWLFINGFDVGVLLNEKLRVTLGYYSMSERLTHYDFIAVDQEHGR